MAGHLRLARVLPFDVAKTDQIFDFYKARDFVLDRLTGARASGCNESLFASSH